MSKTFKLLIKDAILAELAGTVAPYVDQAEAAATAAEAVQAFFEENLLSPAPAQPAPGPMAYFGQDSADKLAADSPDGTRRITLSAGAVQRPNSTADFYIAWHFRTGQQLGAAQREVLASNGGTFEVASNAGISLNERVTTTTSGKWRFLVALNNSANKILFKGLTPALTTQPKAKFSTDYLIVAGVVDNRPHMAIQRAGASSPDFRAIADDIRTFNEFYFPAAAWTNATVERAGNVITVRKASTSATFAVGSWVLLNSASKPEINGVYQIVSRLASNAGFTVASVGADFAMTAADASSAVMRTPADLIDTLGGYKTAIVGDNFGWSGGIQRIECRHGTMPITGGLIDAAWLARYARRMIADADLPGTKRFALTTSALNGWAADADGVITGTATLIGTPYTAPTQGTWISIDPWLAHTPFAAVMDPATGTRTGTVEIGYTSLAETDALIASVTDESGALLLDEQIVSEGTSIGRGTIVVENVPCGMKRYLDIRSARNPNYTVRWGPFTVGPSIGFISQSTWATMFLTGSTGSSLAPISTATGVGTVGDVAGGLTAVGGQPTDTAGDWLRLANIRVSVPTSAGDGIKAVLNKLIELQNGVSGIAMGAGAYNYCRSGHHGDIYWSDRRTWINGIGTATPGVAKTGRWYPHVNSSPNCPVYVEALTPVLYRGGSFAQVDPADITSPYVLTGGTQIAVLDADGNWSGSVSGTFNIDTGDYSITDPVGGELYISAKMQYDTASGTVVSRLANDGFTAWGDDEVDDSGHISNLLKASPRLTAFAYSWANYLLSFASGATQEQVNAKIAFDIAMIRKRIDDNYPHLSGLPWLIMGDPRTTSTSSIGEHRCRIAMRAYAKATPNTYWLISAITGEMDALNSPHPGAAAGSGQLWGLTTGHAIAKAMGIAGAKADEVYITQARRSADGTYVDLTFNTPAGANLTAGDPTKIEGLYFNTADDMATATYVDVVGGAYSTSIIAANKVRVTKASGTFPSTTYWAVNVGFVLQDAVLATENARLLNTLALDTGGYSGIRPGQPVSFNFVNVLASQA